MIVNIEYYIYSRLVILLILNDYLILIIKNYWYMELSNYILSNEKLKKQI